MTIVKNKKLIDELNALSSEKTLSIPEGSEVITDENLIKDLNNIADGNTFSGKFKSSIGAIKEFFTGTKKTEFPELPEIGDLKLEDGKANAAITAGLLINPNQKAQAQIIQSQIPDSKIFQDKFNNIIVSMPDGKSFYLNKPGASLQDFTQTTAQILQYIPGYSMALKKAGTSLLKRGAYAGLAGGATSVAQDIATMPLGSKDIDTTRAVVSTIIPVGFETVVSPVASSIYRKIFGNPKFTKTITEKINGEDVKKVVLNDNGKKAAKEAGIDINKLNDEEFLKSFSQQLSFGTKADIAGSAAAAGKFKFNLARSQAIGDEEGIAALFEAAKGAYGKEAQIAARDFLKQQNIDIETSAKNLVNRFNKGEIEYQSIEDAGQGIMQSVKNIFQKKSDEITTAYNLVDKDGVFQAQNSNVEVLKGTIRKAVDDATATIDKDLTPATIKAIKVVDDFVTKAVKKKPKKQVEKIILNDLDKIQKKLNNIYKTASNKTDQKNIVTVIKEWEKFIDDNVDNILFSGNKNSLQQLKKAKQLYSEKQKLFGINKIRTGGLTIDDKAGKVVGKILNDPDVTPIKTLDYIFGNGTIGKLNDSLSIVKRLKNIFGVGNKSAKQAAKESPDFQALRTGFFERLIRDSSRNGKFNPKQFANIFNTLKQKNKDLLKELFDEDEIKLMTEFVTEVEKTFKPADLVNSSNTASAISRTIQQVGRALVGIFGFKFANIQGLLAARGAFDRSRDIVSQKAAEKLIRKEFQANFGRNINPYLDIGGIVSGQELLNNIRTTDAPPVPSGLIQQ
tara:strand:+ start:982 stop:3354 length:2373 start_codon:yes stop_codon:yes gene_type:complete